MPPYENIFTDSETNYKEMESGRKGETRSSEKRKKKRGLFL